MTAGHPTSPGTGVATPRSLSAAARSLLTGRRALVLGGTGMLGRAVVPLLRSAGATVDAPARGQADLLNAAAIESAVNAVAVASGSGAKDEHSRPVCINCAAWTNVDGAESDEAGATRINGDAVAALADSCLRHRVTLVHFSTDYVFDGAGREPYAVDAPRAPVNAYGRSKAAGEEAIQCRLGAGLDALVIRTSWLYAPWGANFVRTIARFGREKPVLKVVNDQRGRPTSCDTLSRTTIELLAAGARGFFHGTDAGECTWFDFAREIVRLTGGRAAVEPCTTAEFPRPAKRPAYSVLDLTPTQRLIGPMTPWNDALAAVTPRLEA